MKTGIIKKLIFCTSLILFFYAPLAAQEKEPTSKYTLDECIHIAMSKSSDILTAKEEIKRAR